MPDQLLGPFIRRFLVEDLVVDRNLTANTQKSYRDSIRLLLRYMADRHSTEPTHLAVDQLTVSVVRGFLEHLEQDRGASAATRNQRLAAIHSLFRFIAANATTPCSFFSTTPARAPARRLS